MKALGATAYLWTPWARGSGIYRAAQTPLTGSVATLEVTVAMCLLWIHESEGCKAVRHQVAKSSCGSDGLAGHGNL